MSTRSGKQKAKRIREEIPDILDGLSVNRTGEYVKIDENLCKRLTSSQPQKVEHLPLNPFEDCHTLVDTLKNGSSVTLSFLEKCSDERKHDHHSVTLGNILANIPISWAALNRSKMQEDNWDYNVKNSTTMKTSNQYQSGRCWAFSCYNVLRSQLAKKFQLDHKFEFSESYLFFYDKIERSNLFLEYMWSLRHKDLTDREVRLHTDASSRGSSHMMSDGGWFNYFTNLTKKYGLVPKNIFEESSNSMDSTEMNQILVTVLNHMALEIFQNKDNWTRSNFEEKKEEYMTTIYNLVVRFFGEPPKPTDTFTWTYKDTHGETHSIPNLTAEKFYRVVVPHDHETKMTIIHDPRHPENYYMNCWVDNSTNMQDGQPMCMLNLPLDVFKKTIYESLKNDECCWFASAVSNCFDFVSNTFDTERFNYSAVLGTNYEFSKADMLDMGTLAPEHAMCFNGVDVVEDSEGNVLEYKKWRAENSWGDSKNIEDEPDFGFYRMSDAFFDKNVFMASVDLKYFDEEIKQKIVENSSKTFTYSAYDAFGGAARGECGYCKKTNKSRF